MPLMLDTVGAEIRQKDPKDAEEKFIFAHGILQCVMKALQRQKMKFQTASVTWWGSVRK